MTAAPFTHLRYDAHEPLPAFRERQRHAYGAGKAAWRHGQITAQALQLYEELVRFVGANCFAWVKEETLAGELRRSASTIKRWMQQLVEAHLIRRERRFGATSLTYITAYDVDAESDVSREQAAADALPAVDPPSTVLPDTRVDDAPAAPSHGTDEPNAAGSSADLPATGPFFGCTDEPSISSSMSRHSLKHQHVKIGGDGLPPHDIRSDAGERTLSTDRLEAEGVFDRSVLHELRQQPAEQVDQVIRYVARCRTRDDPRRPGLIVHLLRQGFAARHRGCREPVKCLHQPSRRRDQRGRPDQPVRAPSLGDGLPSGAPRDAQSATSMPAADAARLDQLWHQVLTRLAAVVEAPAYDTWLAPSRLLLLDDAEAVVGVPQCFARDEIAHTYAAQLEALLHQLCGRPLALQLVIEPELYRR